MISAHDCPIVAILIEIADMTMLTPGRSVLECPVCLPRRRIRCPHLPPTNTTIAGFDPIPTNQCSGVWSARLTSWHIRSGLNVTMMILVGCYKALTGAAKSRIRSHYGPCRRQWKGVGIDRRKLSFLLRESPWITDGNHDNLGLPPGQ